MYHDFEQFQETALPFVRLIALVIPTNDTQRGTQRQFPPKNIENTF